jgi:hypothetical protein
MPLIVAFRVVETPLRLALRAKESPGGNELAEKASGEFVALRFNEKGTPT